MDNLTISRSFALQHHANQKYGSQPYIYHLDAVAKLVEPYGELAQVIAYLHDTLEDTKVTYDILSQHFNEEIAHCVQLLTDAKISNPKQRSADSYARLSRIRSDSNDNIVLIVKTADRLANMQASHKTRPIQLAMYIDEHPRFKQAVYRSGLCEPLWVSMDELCKISPGLLFKRHLKRLFGLDK